MEQYLKDKEILTVTEVGAFLGICRVKAYELVNQEDFPSFRIGKTIRVRKAALLNWIEKYLESSQ